MKKKEVSIIRSSAAEYLTFITATGESDVNAVYFNENVWLTQKMMGLLYHVETNTINYHLKVHFFVSDCISFFQVFILLVAKRFQVEGCHI